MANKENNEKTSEETIELSVDDLEEASGGVIVDLGDGRYKVAHIIALGVIGRFEYPIGRIACAAFASYAVVAFHIVNHKSWRAREVATTHDISTRVMTESEYVKRTGRQP